MTLQEFNEIVAQSDPIIRRARWQAATEPMKWAAWTQFESPRAIERSIRRQSKKFTDMGWIPVKIIASTETYFSLLVFVSLSCSKRIIEVPNWRTPFGLLPVQEGTAGAPQIALVDDDGNTPTANGFVKYSSLCSA